MSTWICDTCGGAIKEAKDGWVEWITPNPSGPGGFGRDLRLVHARNASPRKDAGGCQFNQERERAKDKGLVADMQLPYFLGPDGLMRLLVFISEAELESAPVLEMIKRLHIPGYEQARKHFKAAINAGAFEPNMPKDFYNQSDIEATLAYMRKNA